MSVYWSQTLESLKIRNFRWFISAQTIRLAGSWINGIALAWVVLEITNSGTALGLAVALRFLPSLILGPIVGVFIDNLPKRKFLIWLQIIGTIVSISLAAVAFSGLISVWVIYAFALLLGVVTAFDTPARQTFLFELVGEKNLQNAVTLSALSANIARIGGPALAGVVLIFVDASLCFFINALTYMGVLIMLIVLKQNEFFESVQAKRHHGQIIEGIKYASSHPIVRTIILSMFIVGFFVFEFAVTLPLFAKYSFEGKADTYTAFAAAMGIGSIIAGLIFAGRRSQNLSTLAWLALGTGVCMILLTFTTSFAAVLMLLAITGGFVLLMTTMANSMLQLHTKPDMRGRMNALWAMMFMGTTPIGGPLMGWIAEQSSPQVSLGLGGIAALAAAFFIMAHVSFKPKSALAPEPVTSGDSGDITHYHHID